MERQEQERAGTVGFLNKRKAAAFLDVSERGLTDLMRSRRIPFYRIGRMVRFSAQALQEHMDTHFKFEKR